MNTIKNKKQTILIVLFLLVLFATVLFFVRNFLSGSPVKVTEKDQLNIAYEIDGQLILLDHGEAEGVSLTDGTSKIVTRYFGNDINTDVNKDGRTDIVFLLTQQKGGGGTFFYVVGALRNKDAYVGTNAILLGDRILPQGISFQKGEIIVNFQERKPDEPMGVEPSVNTSKRIKIAGNKLVEIKM